MRKKQEKPAILYIAKNHANGKRYIGVTTRSLYSRKKAHFYHALKGSTTKFHRAIRKWGADNFEFSVMETLPNMTAALRREVELIAELKPEYNITAGGEGVVGNRHGKKVRQILREWASTPESLNRWEGYRGLGSKSVSMPVLCETTGEIFESQTAAARACGLVSYAVSSVCNGHYCKKALHFKFRRLTEEECAKHGFKFRPRWKIKKRTKAFYEALRRRQKSIICVDDDQYFPSIKDALSYYSIPSTPPRQSNAHNSINNGLKISGHLFAYAASLRE